MISLGKLFGRKGRKIPEAERPEEKVERSEEIKRYREFTQMYEEKCGEYAKEASRISDLIAKIDMDAKRKELPKIAKERGISPLETFGFLCHQNYLSLIDFWSQEMTVYDRTRESDSTFGKPMVSISTRKKVVVFHNDYAGQMISDSEFRPFIDYIQERRYTLLDHDQFLLPIF